MARSVLEYLRLLQSLLPKGRAWNRGEDSALTEFLHGQAEEFVRLDARSDDLLVERDTRTASELLVDHEIDLGIPDECLGLEKTDRQRRSAAHSKLIATGGQDKRYFIDLAATLGYAITITEYIPFLCGLGLAGDECGGYRVLSYWKVSIQYSEISGGAFSRGFDIGFDSLYSVDIETLYCVMNKYKPGHATVIFDFVGPAFDVAFSSGFDSMPSDIESYLEGALSQGFGLGFDVNLGGDFDNDAFGNGFKRSR